MMRAEVIENPVRIHLLFIALLCLVASAALATADPCDGVDNDHDGVLDPGCERACEVPTTPAAEVVVTAEFGDAVLPRIAASSDGFGVAWLDSDSGLTCHKALDPDGQLIGGADCVGSATSLPTITSNGDEYAIAYGSASTVHVSRFDMLAGGLSTHQISSSSALYQLGLAIAPYEFGYFVAWGDQRNGPNQIYFRRATTTGSASGPERALVQPPSGAATQPSLVGNGNGFGLAWSDTRHGDSEIYFARFDDAGFRVGGEVRTTAAGSSFLPRLTRIGGEYALIWTDNRVHGGFDRHVFYRRIDDQGNLVGVEQQLTSGVNGPVEGHTLLPEGDGLLLVWADRRSTDLRAYARRFTIDGNANGPVVELAAGMGQFGGAAASTADPVLIQSRIDSIGTLRAQSVDCCNDRDGDGVTDCDGDFNDAQPLDYPGAPELCDGRDNDGDALTDEGCNGTCPGFEADDATTISEPDADVSAVQLIWTGDGYWALWNEPGDAQLQWLDAGGDPTGEPFAIPNSARVWLGWNGSEAVVSVDGGAVDDTFWRVADPSGPAVVREIDGAGPPVWNGTGWALVDRGSANRLFFVQTDALGSQIGDPLDLERFGSRRDLVWNGSGYGLLHENGFVRFTSLAATGEPIVPFTDLSSTATSGAIDLLWNGGEYVASWALGSSMLELARVDAGGSPVGATITVTSGADEIGQPRLAWTGDEIALLWSEARNGGGLRLVLARVDPSGAVLEQSDLTDDFLEDSSQADLAWNGFELGTVFAHQLFAGVGNPIADPEARFLRARCCGIDGDADGTGLCLDCDDSNSAIYAGACDGLSDACVSDPAELDDGDGDGVAACLDCDDTNADVYPGAPQLCDGLQNSCSGPLPDDEADLDGDGVSTCAGDCDDADPTTFPGAEQICDGKDNTCLGTIPQEEIDLDGDGFTPCSGDCDEDDIDMSPETDCPQLWSQVIPVGVDARISHAAERSGTLVFVGSFEDAQGEWRAWMGSTDPAGQLSWDQSIAGSHNTWLSEVELDGNEIVAIGRRHAAGETNGAMWLVRAAMNGTILAERTIDGVLAGDELALLPAGDLALGGRNSAFDPLVVRTDSTGTPQWTVELTDDWYVGDILAVDDDLVVLTVGPNNLRLTRLDSTGQSVWSRNLVFDHYILGPGLAPLGDGFAVVGIPQPVALEETAWVGLFDESGQAVWDRHFTGWLGGYTRGGVNAIAPLADGTLGMHGIVSDGPDQMYRWLSAIDTNGDLVWSRRLDSTGLAGTGGFWIGQAVNGGLLVAGTREYGVDSRAGMVAHLDDRATLGLECVGLETVPVETGSLSYTVDVAPPARTLSTTNATAVSTAVTSLGSAVVSRCTTACVDRDGDGLQGCFGDCDDDDPATYPGAPQQCLLANNDCDDPLWPAFDPDGDGVPACAGDCADLDAEVGAGAPEINDGIDNQCPGDEGHGAVDEIEGGLRFSSDNLLVSWDPQPGATSYRLIVATDASFTTCTTYDTALTEVELPTAPASGELEYLLVRAQGPWVGSWGLDAAGEEREVPCAPSP